jgi:hypothetical protein
MGDVTVGVARRQDRTAAGAAPDPDRLLRPIVEIVGFGLAHDRAAPAIADVFERDGRTGESALAWC